MFTLRLLDCEVESLSHFTLFGLGFKQEKKTTSYPLPIFLFPFSLRGIFIDL